MPDLCPLSRLIINRTLLLSNISLSLNVANYLLPVYDSSLDVVIGVLMQLNLLTCLCFWSLLKKSVFNPVLHYWMFRSFWPFSISDSAVLNEQPLHLFVHMREVFSKLCIYVGETAMCQTIPVSFSSVFTVAGIHSMVSVTVVSWVPCDWLLASRMCRSDTWFF